VPSRGVARALRKSNNGQRYGRSRDLREHRAMVRELLAGVAGFFAVGFASLLVAGALSPSMRYEDALAGVLIAASLGAGVAVGVVRRRAARRRR
jgi:hypothetical protein